MVQLLFAWSGWEFLREMLVPTGSLFQLPSREKAGPGYVEKRWALGDTNNKGSSGREKEQTGERVHHLYLLPPKRSPVTYD